MKKKDMVVLGMLRANARMSLTEMSRKTRIPVSTLFDRLKSNEKKIIIKHTSLVDFRQLGYQAVAYIAVKLASRQRRELVEYLVAQCAVNSLYRINNGYDFLVEGVFREIKEMQDFIEQMEEKFDIQKVRHFFLLETLKKESFLSTGSYADIPGMGYRL